MKSAHGSCGKTRCVGARRGYKLTVKWSETVDGETIDCDLTITIMSLDGISDIIYKLTGGRYCTDPQVKYDFVAA